MTSIILAGGYPHWLSRLSYPLLIQYKRAVLPATTENRNTNEQVASRKGYAVIVYFSPLDNV